MTSAGNNLTRFTKVSKAQSLDVRFLKKSRASFCSDDGIALAMKESTECCSKSACENARNTRHKYCASVVFSSCDISVSWSLAKASSACIGPPKYCECIVTLVSASVTLSKACATSLQRVALSSHALPALLDAAPRVRSNVSFKAFKDVIALRPSLLFIASGTLSASAFAASTTLGGAQNALAAVDVGSKAPEFTLPGTAGDSVTLSDALKANDYVVLYFYNQDGSPGCSIEAQRFESAIPQFTAKKARVLGVSMDSLEKHEEFCDSKGLKSFTLLSDNDGRVSEAYGADLKIPIFGRFSDRQTFLIKNDGTIVNHWLERDSSMASVKTTAHVDQILAAIEAA